MRYKFRAWHEGSPIGVDPQMIYEDRPGDCFTWKTQGQPLTIMQWTGLTVNDKDVYEHDVLLIVAEDENGIELGREKCVVDFDRHAFVFAPSLKHRGLTRDELFKCYNAKFLRWKLLGNIYEHPELLK